MHVTADHERVRRLVLRERPEQPCARRRVTVPAVGPEALSRSRRTVELGHDRLLRDHVPAGARSAEPFRKPSFLFGTEQRALWMMPFGAIRHAVRATASLARACLVGPVLPVVEHVDLREIAEFVTVIEAKGGSTRRARRAQGHVLE